MPLIEEAPSSHDLALHPSQLAWDICWQPAALLAQTRHLSSLAETAAQGSLLGQILMVLEEMLFWTCWCFQHCHDPDPPEGRWLPVLPQWKPITGLQVPLLAQQGQSREVLACRVLPTSWKNVV